MSDLPLQCQMQRDFCGEKFKNIDTRFDTLDERHQQIHIDMKQILVLLRGNGKAGLVLDVDRLKISHRKLIKIVWAIGGAALVLLTNAVSHFLGF